jgi:hypothetical protein
MSRVSQTVKKNLLAAFRYLLKPLVRLAVKNAVMFPDFSRALKEAYVDVAVRQMSAADMDSTDEGVSLITNIAVSDVRDVLLSQDDPVGGVPDVSPLPTILAAWHTDQKYTGPYGVLRDLEFSRTEFAKDSPSFTDLAHAYYPSVSPRALMDELMRIGAVQEVGNGFYRAIKRSYVPEPLSAPSISMLARSIHNLCETVSTNLRVSPQGKDLIETKGLIQRNIFTVHGIPRSDHAAFDEFIRVRGQAFADDIDNWLSTRDVSGAQDSMQVGVGFYHYIVNEEDEKKFAKEFSN